MGRMVFDADAFKPLAVVGALMDYFQSTGNAGVSPRRARYHFPTGDVVYICTSFPMPDTYDSAEDLVLKWHWYAEDNSNGDVVRWSGLVAAITQDDAATIEDKAPDSENVADEAVLATTKRVKFSSMTLANKDSVAGDDTMTLIIGRNGVHENDTSGETAYLIDAILEWVDN